MTTADKQQRLFDLLLLEALADITAAEQEELATLLAEFDTDRESVEALLASYQLAQQDELKDIPAGLKAKLHEQAEGFATNDSNAGVRDINAPRKQRPKLAWLAAVACLALAVVAWWPQIKQIPTSSQLREQLLVSEPQTIKIEWAQTEDPDSAKVKGDIVWSQDRQQGYMRFTGLPVNDPKRQQYQLWIFDERYTQGGHPVDGGVFDIEVTDGEVVIPIDAKLAIKNPVLFAVTIEKPGGVVVSNKERIVALAQNETT